MTEDERKGGLNQGDWMARYGGIFQGLGWTPYQAECEARAAWEESEEDMGPEEAASTCLTYMREDQ